MEWRDVPGFPGYQVNARGRLRKASGYELGRRGTRYVLSRGGVLVRLTPEERIALAWPPKGEEATPAQPVPPPAPVGKPRKAVPEGFVPLPGLAGYYMNPEGDCIGPRGRPLTRFRHHTPNGPYYRVALTDYPVGRLLEMAFGPGAAVAAGFREPKAVERAFKARAAVRDFGPRTSRHCHDCGRPTNDYRCPACWARLRGSAAEAEESEWNAL